MIEEENAPDGHEMSNSQSDQEEVEIKPMDVILEMKTFHPDTISIANEKDEVQDSGTEGPPEETTNNDDEK